MLSAIVVATEHIAPTPVARSLAALVPLVVSGLVRDVQLAAQNPARFAALADDAGCALVAGMAQAMGGAREPWLLLLLAGYAPEAGFAEEAQDWTRPGRMAAALLRARPTGFLTRLFPDLAAPVGIVATGSLLRVSGAVDFAGLVRALQSAPTLAARARATG